MKETFIDVRAWRQFVAVAEELHFGRAALRLHMTQPPLTQAIAQMERSLGVMLFDRTRRRVALTPAGQAFLLRARNMLDQYDRATMPALRAKSESLTGYLEALIDADLRDVLQVVTPREAPRRGCQLSIRVIGGRNMSDRSLGRDLFDFLASRGVLGDWREPDVIRISPVPLYNTHADVLRFANTVREWRDDR